MKTFVANPIKDKQDKWYVIDATDIVLGRLATRIATVLMGKHRPEYTPHVDLGDHVIVTNCKKVKINGGNKMRQKTYQSYSGYVGGQKEITLEKLMEKKPELVIYEAVRRMLPKNLLAKKMIKKLRVVTGADHEHTAQQPETLTLK